MALIAACTRESKCTISRIHQHTEKNSVQLKEVLTQQWQSAQHASTSKPTNLLHDDASRAQKSNDLIYERCKKCLRHRHFCNSRATCCSRHRRRSDSRAEVENAFRGL